MAATRSWPSFDARRLASDFLSAEQFASACDRIWSTDDRCPLRSDRARVPAHGTTVYCKRDRLHVLWPSLLRRRNRVVLVTSESAHAIPPEHPVPPQIAAWFGTNAQSKFVQPLPLGLGNSYCGVTAKAAQLAAASHHPKTGLLYVNFRPETNAEVRAPLWRHFTSERWGAAATCDAGNIGMEDYVRRLASHRFVLCPRGRGIDTHRMWEALYVGAIPVVERHAALDSFRDLPILFVEDFMALESSYLEQTHEAFLGRTWNTEKLFVPYWKNLFEQARPGTGKRAGWKDFLLLRIRTRPLARFASATKRTAA